MESDFIKYKIEIVIIVAIIEIKYWFAPLANPIPIIKNRYTNSSGSLIAALNLTIDKAPIMPSDSAILFAIVLVIT